MWIDFDFNISISIHSWWYCDGREAESATNMNDDEDASHRQNSGETRVSLVAKKYRYGTSLRKDSHKQ
jgi:hypothetical protein